MKRLVVATVAVLYLPGCSSEQAIHLTGPPAAAVVSEEIPVAGTTARRPPTSAERRSIVGALLEYRPRTPSNACWRFHLRVSTLNERWADAGVTFARPYRKCTLFNGTMLMQSLGSLWRIVSSFSSDEPCDLAPPGVILSLYGVCFFPVARSARATRGEAAELRDVLSHSEQMRRFVHSRAAIDFIAVLGPGRSFAVAQVSTGGPVGRSATFALRRAGDDWDLVRWTVGYELNWCRVAPPAVRRLFSLRC